MLPRLSCCKSAISNVLAAVAFCALFWSFLINQWLHAELKRLQDENNRLRDESPSYKLSSLSEIDRGHSYSSHLDVPIFTYFKGKMNYLPSLGTSMRTNQLFYGLEEIERRQVIKVVTDSDRSAVIERGWRRRIPSNGTQYDLIVKKGNGELSRFIVFRPHSSLHVYKVEGLQPSKVLLVNLVLPFSSTDISRLKSFLSNHVRPLKTPHNLLIVYDDKNAKAELQEATRGFSNVKIIQTATFANKSLGFSRGRSLQIGSDALGPDSLMLFIDVDMKFDDESLTNCRVQSIRGRRVYFPMVFSQFNPLLVNASAKNYKIKSLLQISPHTGWFRSTGFGMACMYKSDFDSVGGFKDILLHGWGGEDLKLYYKFIKSPQYLVVRAPDPHFVHLYHSKECDRSALDAGRYSDCIAVKALNEGSKMQLLNQFIEKCTKP